MLARLGVQYRPPIFAPGVAVRISDAERSSAQPGAPPIATVAFDPELFPPAASRALVLTDQQEIVGAGTVLVLPNLGISLDKGHGAVIRQMQLFADAPALLTRATWRLLIDGVPVPGLAALTLLWRAAASLSLSFDTLRVRVPAGARIDVAITNVDGVARTFGAQLVGWTFQQQQWA